jgi:hypothetical protein
MCNAAVRETRRQPSGHKDKEGDEQDSHVEASLDERVVERSSFSSDAGGQIRKSRSEPGSDRQVPFLDNRDSLLQRRSLLRELLEGVALETQEVVDRRTERLEDRDEGSVEKGWEGGPRLDDGETEGARLELDLGRSEGDDPTFESRVDLKHPFSASESELQERVGKVHELRRFDIFKQTCQHVAARSSLPRRFPKTATTSAAS